MKIMLMLLPIASLVGMPQKVNAGSMRDRMDLANSAVLLKPSVAPSRNREVMNVERILDALSIQFGEVFSVLGVKSDYEFAMESRYHDVAGHLYSGELTVRDLRGLDSAGPALSSADAVSSHVYDLLSEIGFDSMQVVLKTTWLASRERLVGETGGSERVERMAIKSFAYREIGGIPVDGDKIVFTYSLDGTLRKIVGRWTPVNYERSSIASSATMEQFLERAAEALLAVGVAEQGAKDIRLGTHFVREEAEPGVFALRLMGYAVVPGRMPAVHSFNID